MDGADRYNYEAERARKRARMAQMLGGAAPIAGTAAGTAGGALIGSAFPVVGTAGGAAIGGALGGGAGTLAQMAAEYFGGEQTRPFDEAEQRRRERLALLSQTLGRYA